MNGVFAGPFSMFLFLSAAAVALFSFLGVASWSDARRKERESYYKNEMLKKLAESPGAGANSAVELLREEARISTLHKRTSLRIGGLVLGAVGVSLLIFLRALIRDQPVFLCGLIPLLIGMALFAGSYLAVASTE